MGYGALHLCQSGKNCLLSICFDTGTAKKLKRPKELTLGMPPPHNVMNGGEKIEHEKPTTGGDAPQEAEGKEELIDKQPSGQSK